MRTFYSVPTTTGAKQPPPQPGSDSQKTGGGGAPAATRHVQFAGGLRPPTEYPVVETRPPLPARRAGYGGKSSDMVEHMQYLYVHVVKAEGLPVDDKKGGSIAPYVEVRVGNHKAVTKHFENNPSPVWRTIFAFPKQEIIMQSTSSIEVTVRDKKNNDAVGGFVGKVLFEMSMVAQIMPHESPLSPVWYQLKDKENRQQVKQARIWLAVWMGTQADPAFNIAHNTSTRSNVYHSPKLHYIRAHIITAQGVVPPPDDRARVVRVQLGRQVRYTRPLLKKPIHPEWNVDEELMFVTSEPFDERIDVSVSDRIGPGKGEVTIGSISIPVRAVKQRIETSKPPDGQWYALSKPKHDDNNNKKKKKEEEKPEKKPEAKIGIKIGLCRDSGYHVLDESTHYSSDFQPSANHLRKPIIGVLDVGILMAEHLLLQMNKNKEGKMMGGAYCVAKYGEKWVRTRTLINTPQPHWNEQNTWEVFDPCTVITVGVFNDCLININNDVKRDQSIGKVRIRLSTLETNRIYTLSYPLLVLSASGLKKHGELHLTVRFTCTNWANMVAQYREPLLPKMHYVQPISLGQMDWLRNQAMQIVGEKLSLAEPPLRREIVEYMLDAGVDGHMWSLRRSKANFHRIMSLISWIPRLCTWLDDVCYWRNPLITALVYVLFLLLVCYPELIMPTVFLYLFVTGVMNYRLRPRLPAHVDARLSQAENSHPDELDEEYDRIPTSRKPEVVKMRYDRLRSVGGRVQNVIGDLATQGERGLSLLSWRDPRATSVFIIFSVISAVVLYVVPFQAVVLLIGFYVLRHPRFRTRSPSVPLNYFKRLPARSDFLL
ncbi:hypothetical protein OROHE_023689 [Orobanche hederae]